jgi:hypothetical protein
MAESLDTEYMFLAIERLVDHLAAVERAGTVGQRAWIQHHQRHTLSAFRDLADELHQIVRLCVRYAESAGDVQPPLDPMLHGWISDCDAILLAIEQAAAAAGNRQVREGVDGRADEETEDGWDDEEWTLVSSGDALDDDDAAETADRHEEAAKNGGKPIPSPAELFAELAQRTTHLQEFMPIIKT